jgi:hypothetical protein
MLRIRNLTSLLAFLVSCGFLVVIGSTYLDENLMPPFEKQLKNAETGLEGALDIDANDSLSAAARLTSNGAIRRILTEGKSAPALDKPTKDRLLTTAGGARVDVPAFALLLNAAGETIAEIGVETGLGKQNHGLPIFVEAKSGIVRDGSLRVKKKMYRVAAAPVFGDRDGRLLGVVILGWRYSTAYLNKLSASIGYPLVLVDGGQVIGKPVDFVAEQLLKGARDGGLGTVALELPFMFSEPLLVADTEPYRFLAGGRPLVVAEDSAALVILVDRAGAFKTIALAQFAVVLGSVILFLLMLVLSVSEQRSFSEPMNTLLEHLSSIAQGEGSGIVPEAELKGPFLRLGKQVNMILQASQSGGGSGYSGGHQVSPGDGSKPIQLAVGSQSNGAAELSGVNPVVGAPGSAAINPQIGLDPPISSPATGPVPLASIPLQPAAAAEPAMPNPGAAPLGNAFPGDAMNAIAPTNSPDLNPTEIPGAQDSGALSGLFDDAAKDPLAAFRVAGAGGEPPASTPTPPSMPPLPGMPPSLPGQSMDSGAMAPSQTNPTLEPASGANPLDQVADAAADGEAFNADATRMFQVPEALIRESAANPLPTGSHQFDQQNVNTAGGDAVSAVGAAMGLPAEAQQLIEESPDRTVVAQVPADLLNIAGAQQPDVTAEEDAHFRQTHQEFLDARKQCGEDTSQLSYDRFLNKLLKNRQQIRDKYNAKSVRFQVYVKQGKAALRAVPVREGGN